MFSLVAVDRARRSDLCNENEVNRQIDQAYEASASCFKGYLTERESIEV